MADKWKAPKTCMYCKNSRSSRNLRHPWRLCFLGRQVTTVEEEYTCGEWEIDEVASYWEENQRWESGQLILGKG